MIVHEEFFFLFFSSGDIERKMGPYVKFYDPFVIAGMESGIGFGLHGELFKSFSGSYKLKLSNFPQSCFCLYYNEKKVFLHGTSGNNVELVDILRMRCRIYLHQDSENSKRSYWIEYLMYVVIPRPKRYGKLGVFMSFCL
jgi:hypothetical protein